MAHNSTAGSSNHNQRQPQHHANSANQMFKYMHPNQVSG